ncbi:MAG: hypothetical protein QOI66_5198 [Myxococcales bacterium]|nr:hypothetical protein [Myxococcales bacterium]
MKSPAIALVVHGHFYQPPRENPWTDDLQREPSAAPAHDWNARIHAECYRANAFARIHDAAGHIRSIVNNYERLSFNFGPTLVRWMERVDGRTHARLVAADAEQRRRLGHGGALAQAYAHPIVPLLTPADRRTHLLWGLADFRRRFGREAEGLWLPETAVSPQTLASLIELGVKFTILAPEQIAAVRPLQTGTLGGFPDPPATDSARAKPELHPRAGAATAATGATGGKWTTVDRQTLDTGRAYRWLHPDGSGRSIDLAVFDGPLSRSVAFGDAISRAETFLDEVQTSAQRSSVVGQRLVLCASDGELFGHHKKFADLALAFAGFIEAPRRGIEVTNVAAYLDRHPPTWEARLADGPDGEGTAWSCPHGLGRWRRDCGCNMGGMAQGWNQAWRTPLRTALDRIRDAAADLYEDAGSALFEDPWGARDAYGDVVDAPLAERDRLLAEFGQPALVQGRDDARERARLLMEMQRATLLMYASCAWFFDDIAGLESSLVLRLGAHAVDLFTQVRGPAAGRALTADVLAILGQAKSNRPEEGTGADVYRRVVGQRVTGAQAIATSALGQLIAGQEGVFPADVPFSAGYDVQILESRMAHAAFGPTLMGRGRAQQQRTGVVEDADFTAHISGGVNFQCRVGDQLFMLADLGPDEREGLLRAALPLLLEEGGDLTVMRQIFEAVRALGVLEDGDQTPHRRLFAAMLIDVLSRPATALGAVALAFAVELYDAAALPVGAGERRMVEELVAQQIAAGLHADDLTLLARRLGFSTEAITASRPAT